MSPAEYALRYIQLQVPIVEDEKVVHWQEVKLWHYVLIVGTDKDTHAMKWDSNHPDNQAAHDAMLGKLMAHFAKKGATLTVHVKTVTGGVEHSEFDTWKEVWYYARKALYGKGSPEEAQITLQLAARFNLLKNGDFQAYCDKHLGLDCNGFVGNYLVHGFREKDWQLAEPMGTNYLADTIIGTIIRRNGLAINTIDELLPVNTYMMGLVGVGGHVIDRFEGNSFGHILLTQPGFKSETPYTEGKTVRMVPTMFAVESTGGGVGLIEKQCQFLSVKNGIFTVRRTSHPHAPPLRFRVFRVI